LFEDEKAKANKVKAALQLLIDAKKIECTLAATAVSKTHSNTANYTQPEIDVLEKTNLECELELEALIAQNTEFKAAWLAGEAQRDAEKIAQIAAAKALWTQKQAALAVEAEEKRERLESLAEETRLALQAKIESGLLEIDNAAKQAKIDAVNAAQQDAIDNGVTQNSLEEIAGDGIAVTIQSPFDLETLGVDLELTCPMIIGKLRCADGYNLESTAALQKANKDVHRLVHTDGRWYCNGEMPTANGVNCDCTDSGYLLLIVFKSIPPKKAFHTLNLNVIQTSRSF